MQRSCLECELKTTAETVVNNVVVHCRVYRSRGESRVSDLVACQRKTVHPDRTIAEEATRAFVESVCQIEACLHRERQIGVRAIGSEDRRWSRHFVCQRRPLTTVIRKDASFAKPFKTEVAIASQNAVETNLQPVQIVAG